MMNSAEHLVCAITCFSELSIMKVVLCPFMLVPFGD